MASVEVTTPPGLSLTDKVPLRTLDDKGKAPEKRIANATEAQWTVHNLIWAGRLRSYFNARVSGMIDGNPPFSPARLKQAGQSWRTNVNFLEGKASLSAALVPYYDLFSSGSTYAQIQCGIGNPVERQQWSQIMTEEWDSMLKSYEEFDFNMQAMLHDRVCFGKGYLVWPDDDSWWFEHVRQHRVFVPDTTRCSTHRCELLIIRKRWDVTELWGKIKNADGARASGWDVEAVSEAIMNAVPEDGTTGDRAANYEFLQRKLKDRDLSISTSVATVNAAHILVKEFNRKWSHYVVAEEKARKKLSEDTDPTMEYMFKEENKYDSLSQFMATFFLETLDGSWNGASGLGQDIFSAMQLKDRVKCAAVDNTFLRSGITLQAKDGTSLEKVNIIQLGAINLLPPGFEIQNSQIFADVKGPIEMDAYLDSVVSTNTGVYRQRQERMQGNPATAEEVRLRYQTSAVLSNSAVSRFYLDCDKFYKETYRRTMLSAKRKNGMGWSEAARDYVGRCMDRGVPREALDKPKWVRATRNMGNGSLFMRQQIVTQTLPLVPLMPESGRANWLTESIAAYAGQDAADRWNPQTAEAKLPGDHHWQATVENGLFKEGAPVTWTPEQNDLIHAQVHLIAMQAALQSVDQGVDPVNVASFIDSAASNVQQHLQSLSVDETRKPVLQQLTKQFGMIMGVNQKLKGRIQQMQQAQAEQQREMMAAQERVGAIQSGMDPNTIIKAAETQAKIAEAQKKTNAMLAMKAQKHRQSMAISDIETAQRINQSMNAG